ncbi:MAG: ribonuclease D [Gammaproteobacteria bacterium]|nr:ribonuclease D [Gammaproteobacteria bacterium]
MAEPLIMHFQDVNALIDMKDLPVTFVVNDNDKLAMLCARWQEQKVVALDTEFIREKTFFPIMGLIQAADSEGIYLIDPLSDLDFTPFSAMLSDESVIKVLHACGEDLDVFAHFCGVLPFPVFDTQVAAAYTGMDTQMGYQRIVSELYDITLDKHQTRSNWLQRPLSDEQLCYAAEDVRYLLDIHTLLATRLTTQLRLSWVEEECQALITRGRALDSSHGYYLKFRNASHMTYTQQKFLQLLCIWREKEARDRDRPKGFIIQESCLLPIAEAMPTSMSDLHAIQGLGAKGAGRYGSIILSLVEEARDGSRDAQFEMIPAPLRKESKPFMEGLKKASSAKAKELGLKPELLLRRKTLELICQKLLDSGSNDLEEILTGWRSPILLPLISEVTSLHAPLIERLRNPSLIPKAK